MILSSIGQSNNETAQMIYRLAGRTADKMVNAGKIAAGDRDATWARLVAKQLSRINIAVPKGVAAQAGIQTSATGTATAVQATGAGTIASAVSTTASQAAKSVVRGALPIALACFAAESAHTAYKYVVGEIDMSEVRLRTTESAASNAGGVGGAAAGAAIGSAICPGVGTVVGGIIGGIGGAATIRNIVRRITSN